ncbi:MAG: TauD/TfdA family dioxygenase, partial [SAR116 cluster bacterium]|nr:TauD/TfdA family dioxygenase [SAR116 cluster bacterium]
MGIIHTEKLTGPSVWKGPDFEGDDSWIRQLTPAQSDELEAAVAAVQSAGKSFPDFTIDDFRLPGFGAKLRAWGDELESGRGFKHVRGVPIVRFDEEA